MKALSGEVQEWFNWQSWKDCVPQGTAGSNPVLSEFHNLFFINLLWNLNPEFICTTKEINI